METNGKLPRKEREQKAVLILIEQNGERPTYLLEKFYSTALAEKWVREHGQDGQTYSIVTLHRTMACTVETETKTVRRFK